MIVAHNIYHNELHNLHSYVQARSIFEINLST